MIQIEYDRKSKQYQWTEPESGQTLTAPSGRKHELFRAAVAILDPDLFQAAERIIESHPQLERVAWRGVELVCDNKVEIFPEPINGVAGRVESSDGYGRYALTFNEDGKLDCQCEHYTGFDAPMIHTGETFCKHKLAYNLYLVTREDRF